MVDNSPIMHETGFQIIFLNYIMGPFESAQGWRNCTLAVHKLVDSRFLVSAGSESIFTEINDYIYFSLQKPRREFKYKRELNFVPLELIIEPIL